jgi:hypothetical protein
VIVLANLDQEARWSGLGVPAAVARRISAASALLTALAPAGEAVEIFAPAAVDPARLVFARPVMRVGNPARWDLAWADPAARHVNDRRFAHALAHQLDCALPGARAISEADELVGLPGEWVCKAAWTAAGRDRARGTGEQIEGELRARIANLISRAGAVVIEPWLPRVLDFGVCGAIDRAGAVVVHAPHVLSTDARGGFTGIAVREPELETTERDELTRVVAAVGSALARAGYTGPFGIDGFVYRDPAGRRALHSICEINARHTFGHVARALGVAVLGFGPPPPSARVLIAPAGDDPFTAWAGA